MSLAPLTVWPAVDVAEGHVVRLIRGDFSQEQRYANDPLSFVMERFQGAPPRLHLVDLSGAVSGKFHLFPLIAKLASLGTEIQTGGGFRSLDDIAGALDAGARRIIIGSRLIKDSQFRQAALSKFPQQLIAGLDIRDAHLNLSGWREKGAEAMPFWLQLVQEGWTRAQVTDIRQDGTLSGVRKAFWTEWALLPGEIGAGGGISCLDDLHQLRSWGFTHAVVGKAWIEGRISLEEMS